MLVRDQIKEEVNLVLVSKSFFGEKDGFLDGSISDGRVRL